MSTNRFDPTDDLLARDPDRDPALGALLREHRLHERIMVAARRGRLRRLDTPWYGWVARYGRAAVPIGIAAALIAAVILNRSVRSDAEYAAQAAAVQNDVAGALARGSYNVVSDALVGPDSTELFIAMAVDR